MRRRRRLLAGLMQAFRLRRKYGEPVIVVSGLPRSGTSMMMNMLGAVDLEIVTDRVREADVDNPKGYFEDERVKDMEKAADKSWLRDCRGKVVKVISFLLKELPDDNWYKVIFMQRDVREVLASQDKMLRHRGEDEGGVDDRAMADHYAGHLRKVGIMLEHKPNFERLDVDYRGTVENPSKQAKRVARFLGRKLDVERMAAAVDAKLYRNRAGGPGGSA